MPLQPLSPQLFRPPRTQTTEKDVPPARPIPSAKEKDADSIVSHAPLLEPKWWDDQCTAAQRMEIENLRHESRHTYQELLEVIRRQTHRSITEHGRLTKQEASTVIKWYKNNPNFKLVGSTKQNLSGSNNRLFMADKKKKVTIPHHQEPSLSNTSVPATAVPAPVEIVDNKAKRYLSLELPVELNKKWEKIVEFYRSPSNSHTLRLLIDDVAKGLEQNDPLSRFRASIASSASELEKENAL